MTVQTNDLWPIALQAIETWSSAQMHDLGYETFERGSGKLFRYVKYNAGSVTTTISMRSGIPVGPYVASADGTWTANNVTDDASLGYYPIGIIRSSTCSSANCYGFIEVLRRDQATTVLSSVDQAVAQGDGLAWADRHFTTAVLDSRSWGNTCPGKALDSHVASKDQAGSTLAATVLVTPLTAIFW